MKPTFINNNVIDNSLQSNFDKEIILYQKLYKLRLITKTVEVIREYFDYCKSKENFIIIVLYDKNGKVFLKESGINQFTLIGGTVKKNENVRDSVKRIVGQYISKTIIEGLEPIALSKNIYCCGDEKVEHTGLVVMARVDIQNDYESKLSFYTITDEILKCINQFSDQDIIRIFQKRFSEIVFYNKNEFQDEEIEINHRYQNRYKFHNNVIKRFILTSKVKRKRELIDIMSKKTIGSSKFLDISCGDNSLLFSLEYDKNFEFIVANDISWSQIELIQSRPNVFFTNHNAITMPFKDDTFDFVYCSNTLHHMPNRDSLINLLKSMLRVGKKIVIYEIEDPEVTGGFPFFLNKYWYRGFLKDAGDEYLSYNDFKNIIEEAFEGNVKIRFSNFKNIQGNYMIAEIDKKDI